MNFSQTVVNLTGTKPNVTIEMGRREYNFSQPTVYFFTTPSIPIYMSLAFKKIICPKILVHLSFQSNCLNVFSLNILGIQFPMFEKYTYTHNSL